MNKFSLSLAASSLLLTQIFAADVALQGVEISESADDGYRAKTSEVGKTNTPILEIPQTVNVVTQQQLRDKKAQNLTEALQGVSGVSNANSTGGLFDAFFKRGFGANRDGSITRNGVTGGITHNFNATAQTVEVLKGPTSLLYGIQDPGGVINIVTKKPLYDFRNEIWAGVGNNDYRDIGFDTTGPIGESGFAYRFIFDWSGKDYWREFGKYKNLVVAPSVSYRGDDYKITVGYSNTKYTDPFDRGLYLINDPGYAYHGKFAPIDKKTRLGEYLDEVKGNVDTFDFSFEKNFGENWLLKGNYAWSRTNYDYFQARVININLRNSAMNGGRLPVGYASRRAEYLKDVDYYTHAGSLNLNGIVETGDIEHNLLFGIDASKTVRSNPYFWRTGGNTANNLQANIDIYNPVYGILSIPTDTYTNNFSQLDKIKTVGFYAQDSMSLTDSLIYVLGLRYEYYDQIAGKGIPFKTYTDSHNGKFLLQTGLLYLLTPEWSIYTNYAQSFRPQSALNATVNSSLPPEEGRSVEVGTKFQNDDVTASLALFNIDKKNVSYTAGGVLYIAGKQRSKGLELDFSGRVTNYASIIANYTYTKTSTREDAENAWKVGKELESIPKHQGSLFGTLNFDTLGIKGLRMGAGARYLGTWHVYGYRNKADFKMPHAVTYDAFISYDTKIAGKDVNFALNAKNLTDKLYYISAVSSTTAENVIPIIPGYARQIMLTASVKF
nr:TonB-dependent siderophore receptor [uncultured Campylobacter sp.]